MATKTTHQTLTEDLYAIGIHGQTGRDVDEGTLAAGTLVRRLTQREGWDGPVYFFEASTDGGRHWYKQRTYAQPKVS